MNDHEKLEKLHEAIFGDGNGNIGMKAKVDSMYDFFNGATIIGSVVKWVIMTLGAIAAAWYAIMRLFMNKPLF